MARNGSGTYNRAVAPYVAGTTITAATVNSEMDDIATALTQSLSRDGQSPPTANFPMGNFRITGLANAIASTDAAPLGQVVAKAGDTLAGALGVVAGTAAAPGVFVSGDTNTGVFQAAAAPDTLSISVGGTEVARYGAGGFMRLAAGTAAAPAYSFSGDTDTGLYQSAAGQIAISTNGSARGLFDENGNMVIGGSSALQRFNAINSGIGGGAPASSGSAADPNAVARFGAGAVVLDVGATLAGAIWLQARSAGNYATNFPLSLNPNGGGVNMVGPVNVTSGGQTVTGDLEASGNLRFNSGYGSAAIAYGVRAWASVTIAAGVPTMDANGNFTSITDNGVGDFTFNFSDNMPNTHYAIAGSAVGLTNTAGVQPGLAVNTANGQPLLKSTSQVRIGLYRLDANAYADAATFSIMVVR